jgi:hypothetical protein
MQGLLASGNYLTNYKFLGEESVMFADALITELNKVQAADALIRELNKKPNNDTPNN